MLEFLDRFGNLRMPRLLEKMASRFCDVLINIWGIGRCLLILFAPLKVLRKFCGMIAETGEICAFRIGAASKSAEACLMR